MPGLTAPCEFKDLGERSSAGEPPAAAIQPSQNVDLGSGEEKAAANGREQRARALTNKARFFNAIKISKVPSV